MAEIKLIIEMDGQQTVVNVTDKVANALKKVGGNSEEADKKLGGFKKSLKEILAFGRDVNQVLNLMGKAVRTIRAALEFARAGAIFAEQTLALDALAKKFGQTADTIVAGVQRASGGMASLRDATKQAARAITLGLKPTDVVKFAKIARASAKAMGTDFNKMFESITVGVARQSKLWLDNLGIIINVEEANRRYAQSLGITAKELTEVQRRQAFTNEALRQGEVIVNNMADVMDTTADKFREASAAYDDFILSLQQGAEQDIAQTGIVEGGTDVLKFLTEWQNEANEFKTILEDIRKVSGKTTDGLINMGLESRSELVRLRNVLEGISRDEMRELQLTTGLAGTEIIRITQDIDTAILISDKYKESWRNLTAGVTQGKGALGLAINFINKARAAAKPGTDFVMRVRAKISGVAGAILEFFGIIPKGAPGAAAGGGGGGGGGAAADPAAEAVKTIDRLIDSFARLGKTKLELAIEQLNIFAEVFPELATDIETARNEIEEFARAAEEMKRFKKIQQEINTVVKEFVKSSMTEADILRERAEVIERTVNLRRQELGILEATEDQFIQQGEAAVAILLEQVRLEERKIELARLDNELAGKGILNDLTQMQILERTIELRKTELVIAQQIAEAAETQRQNEIAARFGGMREDPGGLITRGGAEGPGGTELDQLQLTADQRFEILHMAFVRETELRMEHAALVQEINTKMLEEGKRAAEQLVAGGFEVIGRGLGDMIAGTQKGSQEFGKAMQALVGEAAAQFGKFLITMGVGNVALSIFPPNPQAATAGIAQIVAGTALVALGRVAAAAAQAQPSAAAAGAGAAGGAPRGAAAPTPAPLPAEAPGGGFVMNVFVENGDVIDINDFVENRVLPVAAKGIGRGNLGSREFNLFARRE